MNITAKQLDAIDAKIVAADALKQTVATQTAFLRETKKQLEELESEIEAFADDHREEIGKQLLLRHGRIGYNTPAQPALVLAKGFTWEKVVEKLKHFGLTAYLRISEEPDKQAIKKDLAGVSSELRQIGCTLDDSPKFYWEVFKS